MGQSLASYYAAVIERSFAPAAVWSWPREQNPGEARPDSRLLSRNSTRVRAEIQLQNGAAVKTRVKLVTSHDLILAVDDLSVVPAMGQVVEVCLERDEVVVADSVKAIVHWSGQVYGQAIVALFTIESMEPTVERSFHTKPRGDVRFPLDLPGVIRVADNREVFGRLVNYSLSGGCFLAEEAVGLEVNYPLTMMLPKASVKLTLRPTWVLFTDAGYQMGCAFEPEQGVLLACRHHPIPTELSTPLTPQTDHWDAGENCSTF